LLVDTQGLVLKVKATGAHVPERDGAYQLLEPLRSQLPRLQIVWADQGYSGEFETWIQERLGWRLEIVRRTSKKQQHAQVWATARQRQREGASVVEMWAGLKSGRGIEVLPRRWVVERTFAWLGRYRRLSKAYEFLAQSSEAVIYLAMPRLMLTEVKQNGSTTRLNQFSYTQIPRRLEPDWCSWLHIWLFSTEGRTTHRSLLSANATTGGKRIDSAATQRLKCRAVAAF
jgi:transposase